MRKLSNLTYTKIGEIYDRLSEGKGIISRKDEDILDLALRLKGKLRKINFPASKNAQLHDYMVLMQYCYSKALRFFIRDLQKGCQPIYYANVAQEKYKEDFDKIKITINHDVVSAAFMDLFEDNLFGIYNEKFGDYYIEFYHWSAYFYKKKDLKKSSRDTYGNVRQWLNMMYEKSKIEKLSDDEILQRIHDVVMDFHTLNDSEESPSEDAFGNQVESKEDDWKSYLYRAGNVPQDAFYDTMIRNVSKLSFTSDFLNKIEYIMDIPSRVGNHAEEIRLKLERDIELIEELQQEKEKWKKRCRKNDPPTFGTKLCNLYKFLMKDFNIPSLTPASMQK